MKQLKHLVLYLPFVLAAVGCSQDELTPDGGTGTGVPEGLHEVEITFNMGTSAGLQTRAMQRPVISSDNWQRVSDMRIYVFKSEAGSDDASYTYYRPTVNGEVVDYIYVDKFAKDENWGEDDENKYNLEVPVWGDDDNTEKDLEQHLLTKKIQLEADNHYKFLAIGRDDISGTDVSNIALTEPTMQASDYPSSFLAEEKSETLLDWLTKFEAGSTALNRVILRCGNNTGQATEVFKGISDDIYVTEGVQGFTCTIELKRSVAGFLMYVKNIPSSITAKYNVAIEDDEWDDREVVVESGKSYTVSNIAIGTIAYSRDVNVYNNQPDGKRAQNINIAKHVVDYYNFSQRYEGSTGKFLTSFPTATEDGYTFYKIDHSNDQYEEDKTLCENSVRAGGFFLPQTAPTEAIQIYGEDSDENKLTLDGTLYLVFFTQVSNASYPFYWIPIKCQTDKTFNPETGDYTDGEHTGDAYKFPIQANCFYSLGTKNYKTGEDEPIDLKEHFEKPGGDNNLVITVNPHWDWKGELEWAD